VLYKPRRYLEKASYFLVSTANRILDLLRALRHDLIFIQREAFPYGPPIFEKLLARLGKPIIYDFDDAIYLPQASKANKLFIFLKNSQKTKEIIRLSQQVIVGNDHLKEYAIRYSENVTMIPTAIDTDRYLISEPRSSDIVTLGWIGSHSTLPYLNLVETALRQLSKRYDILLRIVGGEYHLEGVQVDNRTWSLQDEVSHLQSFDIGLMPLLDNERARGKCGFKALQYMAVGVPCVCSPVGVNREIVQDGYNGYLAGNEDEWIEKFSILIESPDLRCKLGLRGRATVEERYSIKANLPKLLTVLKTAAQHPL